MPSMGLGIAHRYQAEPAAGQRQQGSASRAVQSPKGLAGLIEGQIIPRLLFAHRDGGEQIIEKACVLIGLEEATALAAMALRVDAHGLMERVDSIITNGAGVEAVLIDLLAPAARQLGIWWEEDECDFVDVTMGLWRLQQVVYDVSARYPGKAPLHPARKALFTVFPGEQHSFGTSLVEECFRRNGWLTTCLGQADRAELLRLVADHHFDLIGITMSCDRDCAEAAAFIDQLRSNSKNPVLGVMVGGRVLVERPELAPQMGADATADDAVSAVARADAMMRVLDGQKEYRC
jgi:MerR family transcriptional regulator, light-induced transcriptional regulator